MTTLEHDEKFYLKIISLYGRWVGMIKRCHDPKSAFYKDYGARGVFVCDEWRNSFAKYVNDVGLPPDDLQLDRIDNDRGYFKDNCRWVTRSINLTNKRSNKFITYNGETKTYSQWAKDLGMSRQNFYSCFVKNKKSLEYLFMRKNNKSLKKIQNCTTGGEMIENLKRVVAKKGILTVSIELGYKSTMTVYVWIKNNRIPPIAEKKVKEYLKGEKRENK